MSQTKIGLAFGSNLGNKKENIRNSLVCLNNDPAVSIEHVSRFFDTPPWGIAEQDRFVNCCAIGRTSLDPHQLLHLCKKTERDLGRTVTVRWGPRIIDIDILFFGTLSLETPALTVPHKGMMDRSFVLIPLAEIAPDLEISGKRISHEAAKKSLEKENIVPLEPVEF